MTWTPPTGVIPTDRKSPSVPTMADIPAMLDWLRDYYPGNTVIGVLATARAERMTYRVDGEPGYGTPGTLSNYTLTKLDWGRDEIDAALADIPDQVAAGLAPIDAALDQVADSIADIAQDRTLTQAAITQAQQAAAGVYQAAAYAYSLSSTRSLSSISAPVVGQTALIFTSGDVYQYAAGTGWTYLYNLFDQHAIKPVSISPAARKPRTPMIVAICDDGSVQDGTVMVPLFDNLGIKGCFAINPGTLSAARRSEYLGYSQAGHEIMSHSLTHLNQTTLTPEQLETDLRDSRDQIRGWGIPCNNYVYPYNAHNAAVRAAVSRYYRSAAAGGTYNPLPLQTYAIARRTVGNSGTLAGYNSWVDAIVASNGLLVLLIHPGYDFNATQQQNFRDFVAYAKSQGCTFATMNEALDVYGNQFEVGDVSGAAYAVVDRDGVLTMPATSGPVVIGGTLSKLEDGTTALNNDTPPSAFPNGRISWYPVSNISTPAFITGTPGQSYPGVLMTQRVGNTTADGFANWDRQVFYEYLSDKIWTRRGNNQSSWLPWVQIGGSGSGGSSGFAVQAVNHKNAAALYTEYASGALTVFTYTGASTGWPVAAGTVYTDRTSGTQASGSNLAWIRQTVYDFYSDAIWQRRVNNADGTWTAFTRIDAASIGAQIITAAFLASTAPNAFTSGKMVFSYINSGNISSDTGGVYPPGATAGLLVTEAITTGNGANRAWTKQYWWPYNAGEIWFRTATSDTAWGTWERIVHSPSVPVTQAWGAVSVPAGGAVTQAVTVTGAVIGNNVIATPDTDLELGLVVMPARVTATGTVTLRIYNHTPAAISMAARNWKVVVIR